MKPRPALLRAGLLLAYAVGAVSLRAQPLPTELAVPAHALDPAALSPDWQELLGHLQVDAPLQARFSERRQNDFRRMDRNFSGVLRIRPDAGVSLEYPAPLDVTLVAAPGTVWRRPSGDDWTAYAADPESGMGAWSHALWQLDLEVLADSYAIYGEQSLEAERWRMFLTPKENFRLPRIALEGSSEAIERVLIERSPRQRTTYTLDAVDRSPDTSDWDAYFPAPE